MKKLLACSIIFVILVSLCVFPASAASTGKIIIRISGEELTVPAGMGVPFITNNSTLIPMRVIFEALGYEVAWDAKEKAIYVPITTLSQIEMKIGSKVIATPNLTFDIPTAPLISGGRTYVPLRAVSEALNFEVNWTAGDKAGIKGYVDIKGTLPTPLEYKDSDITVTDKFKTPNEINFDDYIDVQNYKSQFAGGSFSASSDTTAGGAVLSSNYATVFQAGTIVSLRMQPYNQEGNEWEIRIGSGFNDFCRKIARVALKKVTPDWATMMDLIQVQCFRGYDDSEINVWKPAGKVTEYKYEPEAFGRVTVIFRKRG